MLGEHGIHFVLSTDEHDFTDFCYASEWVRALSSASGKSGKSVDNNKKSLVARREMPLFFLSTDEQDFTDVYYAVSISRKSGPSVVRLKINVDARRALSIVFFEPQIFTDLTDFCYASE